MKIAICGPICSGKSYISDYLVKKYKLTKYAFGDKVKDIARDLFSMTYKDRKLIQTIADKMKDIEPDIWAKYVIAHIKNSDNIIIDDLRFLNEASYLHEENFIIIKLTIDKETQLKRLKHTYPKTYKEHINNLHHNSEQFYDQIKANYNIISNKHILNTIDVILMNHN